MDRIDYIKYSRSKALEYQTRTSIGVSGGKRIVEKSPCTSEGIVHITSFVKKHDKLQNVYLKVKPVDVILIEKSVYFPFIDGESLYDYLEDSITDTSELIKRIKKCFDVIFAFNSTCVVGWNDTKEFDDIFGKSNGEILETLEAVAPANIDAIFENFIISEDGNYTNIDYEWTFDFPVPIYYIKYRTLMYFYSNNRGVLGKSISQEAFFEEFGIKSEWINVFSDMEDHFQNHVHGIGRKYIYNSNYAQYNAGYLENPEKLYCEDKTKQYEKTIREKDKRYHKLEKENKKLHYYLDECNKAIVELRDTYSVKRKITYRMNKIVKKIIPSKVAKAASVLKNDGMAALLYKVKNYNDNKNAYERWIELNEINLMESATLDWNPKI